MRCYSKQMLRIPNKYFKKYKILKRNMHSTISILLPQLSITWVQTNNIKINLPRSAKSLHLIPATMQSTTEKLSWPMEEEILNSNSDSTSATFSSPRDMRLNPLKTILWLSQPSRQLRQNNIKKNNHDLHSNKKDITVLVKAKWNSQITFNSPGLLISPRCLINLLLKL